MSTNEKFVWISTSVGECNHEIESESYAEIDIVRNDNVISAALSTIRASIHLVDS